MPLLYPFDLEDGVFDDCPYDVINDHLRCWNSIDEKVVGESVTTPIFSDGVVDYRPREHGPGFLMCGVPMHMHSNNKKRSHTQLDSRKQVIAFQDRVITINIKEAQHPLK